MLKFKCAVCEKYITDDEGITTCNGDWVCDKDTCRLLDSENNAIRRFN